MINSFTEALDDIMLLFSTYTFFAWLLSALIIACFWTIFLEIFRLYIFSFYLFIYYLKRKYSCPARCAYCIKVFFTVEQNRIFGRYNTKDELSGPRIFVPFEDQILRGFSKNVYFFHSYVLFLFNLCMYMHAFFHLHFSLISVLDYCSHFIKTYRVIQSFDVLLLFKTWPSSGQTWIRPI